MALKPPPIPQSIVDTLTGKIKLLKREMRDGYIHFDIQTEDGDMWFHTTTSGKHIIVTGMTKKVIR